MLLGQRFAVALTYEMVAVTGIYSRCQTTAHHFIVRLNEQDKVCRKMKIRGMFSQG